MLFNSIGFIFVYLPIVFLGFFFLARRNQKLAAFWLAIASLFFYGWWNPKFVSLLLASICFNYGAGYLIGHGGSRAKAILVASVASNLVLLGVFKYANFFVSTLNSAGAQIGLLDIILPLGISFFTFTQIAFLVDVYRGIAKEYNFVHYLLFVTWFPHLIAGPVLHHKQMMPQFALASTYKPNVESIAVGLTFFSVGLFKKVYLADHFALFANPVFDSAAHGESPKLIAAWVGAVAYALQLYFDFSGYSDMAIGLSRMFNIKLPLNFDSPYKAASIIDFWRRWHMTLSKFLRDYLYVPLGGNRKGPVRRHFNLLATMLLGGLWHGAGWNFVLWGGLHGVFLIVNHGWRWLTRNKGETNNVVVHALCVLLTFTVVVVAWVPFRAESLHAALVLWNGMIGLNGVSLPESLAGRLPAEFGSFRFDGAFPGLPIITGEVLIWVPIGLGVIWVLPNSQQWLASYAPAWDVVKYRASAISWRPTRAFGVVAGLLFAASVVSFTRNSPFLYFQF
ncbi:MBOAT family protein [Variovorax sp. YR216]|uniref:MBOAT family O-acyltransferase n=1 Tax=Variovorax sp. YR216 TaxID=1882828 RepID=UPI000896C668|nr:MBOAT family protein [Variovorax sp. YR216]SEA15565.1 D-alanyl-lipoteichoic acid acyltransferase DltB, MBOAT superfamily [Variovorax sp. YR216]